jgi:hypothetical protein
MRSKFDRVWLGLVLGLLAPWLVMLVYYRIVYSYLLPDDFLHKMFVQMVFLPVLSLCVVVNLGIFFLFIWTEKYFSARGVIFATLLYAIYVFAVKLMQ